MTVTKRTLSLGVLRRLACVAACMACDAKRAEEVLEDAASIVTDVPCPSDGRPLLEGIVHIEADWRAACALDQGGRVYCWGAPILESERGNPVPWQVQDLPPVREMQVYDQESFAAIARDGDVYVWGSYVQPYYRLVPSPMCEPSSVHCRIVYEPLDPSLDAHLAAALHPEEVVALDDGDPPQRRSTKRAIPTRTAKTRGHFVGPGLIHDPNVGFRWADREDAIATARMNRAGAGTPDDPVVRLVFVPDSSTSTDFWCRVFRSGAVSCDIPDPFHEEPDRTPASFQLPARVRAGGHVDSGLCPLEDGRVAAWADDYDPYVPTEVAGMLSVDNDTSHSCGLRGDGSAWCWTQPRSRRRAADQTEPRKVDGIRDAVDIAVGLQFACAVLSDGHVRCWGDNEVGQLGNGTFGEPIAKACSVVAPGEPT